MTLYALAMTLILVMDPFGNVPVFLSVLHPLDDRRKRLIILREMVIALAILLVFLFFGKYILKGFSITENAISIAGGVIMFIIALKMIFPQNSSGYRADEEEPMIVPLAVPFVAGPSTITVLVVFSSKHPNERLTIFFGLLIAWAFSSAILVMADLLGRLLGRRVLRAIERLMGMILTALAVQMFLNGIESYL
jgi:multiple antibiotic resistance protein